jgi:hypothetical protein
MRIVYLITGSELIDSLKRDWERISIRLTHTEILNLSICKN